MDKIPFHKEILKINDIEALVEQIAGKIKDDVSGTLHRFGGVIGLSGGIDSSVSMALAVRALGADKIFGIMMPEKDSSPDSKELATLGVQVAVKSCPALLDRWL